MRIPWSEDEALIIVDAFHRYKSGQITRNEAIKSVSTELRDRAKRKGIDIDTVFRNENGIGMQMATLEHIYSNGETGLRSGSKLFRNTMRMYDDEPLRFIDQLQEARSLDEKTMAGFEEFLLSHFAYGFRIDSPIEMMRFKRFYEEDRGEACPWDDEEIKEKVNQTCFIHEGKGYVLSEEATKAVLDEIEELHENGNNIIYYGELFAKNEEWFHQNGFFSDEMLKSFLQKIATGIVCRKGYFAWESFTENDLLRENIISVWNDNVLMNYAELKQILEYVPLDKIKYALANNACFVWNSNETYTIDSKFIISEYDSEKILDYVEGRIRENGFVSFDDMPLETVFEENYELSETAIFALVFDAVLSDKYEKINRAVTLKGDKSENENMLVTYCKAKPQISIDELFEQWEVMTGTHRQAEPLDIAYTYMIRVDAENFVSDNQVTFDTATIDKALDSVVVGEAIGLKEVTSFAMFPDCNFSWNLYLLESFCRRFSKTFKYMAVTTNSRNAGAIVRKECSLDYHNLIAHVLSEKKVELNEDAVMDYLFEKGFIARRSYKNLSDLIDLAAKLNEGRLA